MTFGKMKDGQGSQNSASGANSLTRTYLSKFFLITCTIREQKKTISKGGSNGFFQRPSE